MEYCILRWGYDSTLQAYAELTGVAEEEGVPAAECTIVRYIHRAGPDGTRGHEEHPDEDPPRVL
jgi:hypothetical protein